MNIEEVNEARQYLNENEDIESEGPEEEDCFIKDNTRSGYDVSCGGKYIDNYGSVEESIEAIIEWQEKNNYYPTIWFVNERGDTWPVDRKGNEIKSN